MSADFFHACLGFMFTGIWIIIGQIMATDTVATSHQNFQTTDTLNPTTDSNSSISES